ncbi:MAG: FHA domain-containing protein [Gammaproteobacteria bacterium]|nr:FHA domain-containing protein [Gammaproteobacteria bacterium]
MSHLVVTLEDKLVGEFPITKEKMTIGRKPDNDICINNLAISSYHTQIITVLDSSFLEDLNSTNGTYVNARLVKKHALEDGDLIDVGNHRIRYVGNEPQEADDEENDILEKTIVLSPGDAGSVDEFLKKEDTLIEPRPTSPATNHPAPIIDTRDEAEVKETSSQTSKVSKSADSTNDEVEPKPAAAPSPNPVPPSSESTQDPDRLGKLQVLNGKNAGLVLDLKKSLTTFGSPKLAVAGVTKRAKGYFLIHVQGQDGQPTLLNGEPLKDKATQLEDNDIIEVANIKLEFFTE